MVNNSKLLVEIRIIPSASLFASERPPLQLSPDVGFKSPMGLSLLNPNPREVNGFKVFKMLPECEKENIEYCVFIADVSSRKEFGAVKKERCEKFEFERRFLKISSGMKLGDNGRFCVFLQIHFKLSLDLERGRSEWQGRERAKVLMGKIY